MKISQRFLVFVVAMLFVAGFATSSFGQQADPEARAGVAAGAAISSSMVFDAVTGELIDGASGLGASNNSSRSVGSPSGARGGSENSNNARRTPLGGTIDGLDTLATFDGAFAAQAGPSLGNVFRFTMIGNPPLAGGTTLIPSQISEVSLTLLNADGSTLTTVPFAPFDQLCLDSPNFAETDYRSGQHIQYGDAVHRAQFFNRMDEDWHTILRPHVVNRVSITVPRFVNVRLSNGTIIRARTYFIGTAADGNTFVLMLNLLFNSLFANEVVNEINLGNFTTDALNMTLFPNTYLFSLNVNNPNTPGGCCVLGFHTYFFEQGVTPQPRWVTQYASWISPGLFGGGFQDVTALSHETAEAFGDPFIDNATPRWQFPNQPPTSKFCQSNLEEGDPIEVLPVASIPIPVREGREVFTYHPQIIPLLQWFEMGATSNAIDGAFSFPDETALPHSAVPCPN